LLLGRYKGAGNGSVKVTGTVNGVAKAYTFPVAFAGNQPGNTHLPRLWAMRRIGHLTEVAQDNGNNREVVDEIIGLSKKYGIISAYTSYLVTDPSEPQTIARNGFPVGRPMPAMSPVPMSRRGDSFSAVDGGGAGFFKGGALQRSVAMPSVSMGAHVRDFREEESALRGSLMNFDKPAAGKDAVIRAKKMDQLKVVAQLPANEKTSAVKTIEEKTFYLRDGVWTDASFDGKQKLQTIAFGSKEYFDLAHNTPGIAKYLSAGRQLILLYNGIAYRITYQSA
jgi:Ca-activated chloride channel family protein